MARGAGETPRAITFVLPVVSQRRDSERYTLVYEAPISMTKIKFPCGVLRASGMEIGAAPARAFWRLGNCDQTMGAVRIGGDRCR